MVGPDALDRVREQGDTPGSAPDAPSQPSNSAPSLSPRASASPSPVKPSTQSPQASNGSSHPIRPMLTGVEKVITTAYLTARTRFDQQPHGPKPVKFPVVHEKTDGRGTFDNPITAAVGASEASGQLVLDYPAGTRFYIPEVQRYFVVEDICALTSPPHNGPCHSLTGGSVSAPEGATTWIDVWIDGQSASTVDVVKQCAIDLTQVTTVVVNPKKGYPVPEGEGVFHGGRCDRGYGNEVPERL